MGRVKAGQGARSGARRLLTRGQVGYGELPESVGFLLRRAQLLILSDLIAALEPLDLRPAQFTILVLIDANPNLAQSELCDALGIQRPNFVKILDEFEGRGLTQRISSPADRRIKTVAMTPKGEALFRQAVKIHAGHEARLRKRLGVGGSAQFEGLLQRIVESD